MTMCNCSGINTSFFFCSSTKLGMLEVSYGTTSTNLKEKIEEKDPLLFYVIIDYRKTHSIIVVDSLFDIHRFN